MTRRTCPVCGLFYLTAEPKRERLCLFCREAEHDPLDAWAERVRQQYLQVTTVPESSRPGPKPRGTEEERRARTTEAKRRWQRENPAKVKKVAQRYYQRHRAEILAKMKAKKVAA